MEVIANLKNLLNDICTFLTAEVLSGNPSEHVKNRGMSLMHRVVKMKDKDLLELMDAHNYTDMNKNASLISEYVGPDAKPECNNSDEVYSTPIEEEEKKIEHECPYRNALISDLDTIKQGPLYRREKIIFWNGNREYHVALINEWLLLYANKKYQANEIYPLKSCQASDKDKKDEFSFTLVAQDKTFLMAAKSFKEKKQWISAINDIENYKLANMSINEEDTREIPLATRHVSIESDGSNIYADPIEPQQSPTKRKLPPTPVEVINTNANNPVGVAAVPELEEEDIYNFVSPPAEYTNDNVTANNAGDEEIYHFAEHNALEPEGPECDYDFVSNFQPGARAEEQSQTEEEDQEGIYETIAEHMRPSSRAPPTSPKPAVPPPPREKNMLNELKLRQKLRNSGRRT